ncbi:centromere protein L [Nilaparvata lugens]|uniref:centromere protein L n=1 Tax=Nilaparvata lugens TaxID=108931 RepID=UPI00193CD433|nr:centromere protein L [Nilaparvata lugens]XP_022187369.2 centromere protein L [Nilaparvata lugens]
MKLVEMEVDPPPNICFNDDLILDLIRHEDEGESEDCKCLINKAWTVRSCTPLHNFSYAESDLRSYGLAFSNIIQKECSIKYVKCEFEVVSELAFSNKDNKSVKITVHSTVNGRRKALFESYLVSRNSSFKPRSLTRLPVFLYNGSLKVALVVIAAIQFMFGGHMSEMKFSVNELLAFTVNHCWKPNAEKDDDSELDLVLDYELPVPENSNIEYSIESSRFKELFSRIIDQPGDETSIMSSFHNDILHHFYNNYEMNLDFFNLSTINLKNHLKIARKGKIKCNNPSVLNTMLKYLTQNINESHKI